MKKDKPPRTQKLLDLYLQVKIHDEPLLNEKSYVRCLLSELEDMERSFIETKADKDELQALFDLQHKRTVTAEKLWQAEHKTDALPDLGELLNWLMKKVNLIKE